MLHVQFAFWSSRNEFNSINFILSALQKHTVQSQTSIYASWGRPLLLRFGKRGGGCPRVRLREATRLNWVWFPIAPRFLRTRPFQQGACVAAAADTPGLSMQTSVKQKTSAAVVNYAHGVRKTIQTWQHCSSILKSPLQEASGDGI